MKTLTGFFCVALILLASLFGSTAQAQNVLSPTDTVITYNSAKPPTQPTYGQIGKWVRTVRLSWNTTGYKCYIYKGQQFRLYYPKSYNPTANDGKKYPMLMFYHGVGEAGTVYDNEYQLYHGGQIFANAVANGIFDGYVLCMQTGGGWGPANYVLLKEIIDYMVINNKLDAFHVIGNGLSGGGQGTWTMFLTYPTYNSGIIPMSAVDVSYVNSSVVNTAKFTPIWNMHGGLDGAPAPATAQQVTAAMAAGGANYTDKNYPTLGHDVWDSTWLEPNFWPFINAAYAANPWTLFGRTQFCPTDTINLTVGLAPGFDAYQWRKNGTVITGATTNSINVTSIGTYDARVLRGSVWSDWSHVPVVISIKAATVTPPITVASSSSTVIPDLNNNGTVLQVPTGYTSYTWQKVGSTATIGTGNTLAVSSPGNYMVKVTELFGCSSNFSAPFPVIDANGPNKPDAASGVLVTPISKTALRLDWNQSSSPVNNETGFEIYQATKSGGPYTLAAITGQDVSKDTITGLTPGATYYYKIRAIDATGAAAASNEASGTTIADTQAPTSPGGLTITGTTRTSVALSWTASTDDVGVAGYNVYVNGVKTYSTTNQTLTVYGLQYPQTYAFVVKAFDLAGNLSVPSNQVSGEAKANGLTYQYYPFTTIPTVLPDFNTQDFTATGITPTVSLTPATQTTNYGFLWTGYIQIPTSGTYSFRTTSVDGSELYLGTLNGTGSPYNNAATPLVSNDGTHGSKTVTSSNVTLSAGTYPIAISYFHGSTGTAAIALTWKTPSSGTSYVSIPATAFVDAATVSGTAPAAPSNLVATTLSYNKIGLQWNDNSTNETGFEIYRSTSLTTGFTTVGLAVAGATSFTDSTVTANTRYYYQIRAVGQYGQSAFCSNYREAYWQFNNNLNDSSGNAHVLTGLNSPVYDATAANKEEGAASIKLNGTNQALAISNTNSFLNESYSQRTIAFWMKTASNTGNRVIFDIGTSANGLAMLLNNNTLIAAVASGSVRVNFSTPYTSTGWNHIALVYNANSLLLYVNGVLKASNTSLSFSSLATNTDLARIGQTNGTNAFNTTGTPFSGWIDAFGIYNTALGSDVVNAIMNQTFGSSNATTQALPAAPAVPSNLVATAVSSSAVNIKWNDNASNETQYELYRSNGNNQNYILIATLPANTTTYNDAGLFSNSTYYYHVRAINAGGASAYATEVSVATPDNLPVITKLANQSARYGTATVIPVSATSTNSGTLTFTASNLPSFASFTDNGDRTASLTVNPAVTDQGNYTNLRIVVSDAFGGADTTTFSLNVNNNYTPVIDPISSYTINENDTLSITLNAHDSNTANTLTLSVNNAPSGYTLTPSSNGVATLLLHPGYTGAGVYNVQVTANDNNGLSATRSFVVTVKDKDPNTKIYTRYGNTDAIGAPWNTITAPTTTGLLDGNGNVTTAGVTLNPNWWFSSFNGGPTTGNNSGVYPDPVLLDYYYFGIFGGPDSVNGVVTGLDTSKTYNLTFFATSVWNGVADNGNTTFGSGSQNVSLYVQNNLQNTASLNNLKPAADGTIPFVMGKAANATVGYLNSLVITQQFDDGSAPAGVGGLTAATTAGQVQLNWTDSAFNATGYEVWRAPVSTGTYTLLSTVSGNSANTYTDSLVTGNTAYSYKVRAVNTHGNSGFTAVAVTTLNRLPKINAVANISLKNTQQLTVNVTTIDDSTAHLTLTASNLPPFASFTDNGNGTGVITISPSAGTIGVFPNATITVSDALDSTASTSFTVAVTEPNVSSVYVNFSDGTNPSPKPWNTMAGPPFPGTVLSNLVDDSNNPTTMSLTLNDGFQWVVAAGMQPYNGHSVYPDVVLRTAFYESATTTHTIKVSGLSATKRYNFVFFGSHDDGLSGLTNYSIGTKTVSLQTTHNINKTVQINNITPDNTGSVNITVAKGSGASNAFITSLVIQSYDSATAGMLNPADLRIVNIKRKSLTLQWQDRGYNETGFEVWRANDSTSSAYKKIATVGANVTTYLDASVSQNKTYYYLVRAVNSTTSATSGYSNPVSGSTYNDVIYINFTATNEAPLPWNNLNGGQPQLGYTWYNFLDETSAVTSVGMQVTSNWSGLYGAGQSPGDNSGIYPDSVLLDSYGLFPGVTGTLLVSGLDQSKVYDFTFLGSSQAYGDVNTAYTVNGNTTILNTSLNIDGTTTLYGIVPDANGNVNLSVAPADVNSQFGLINALVVQGYTLSTNTTGAPTVPGGNTGTEATSNILSARGAVLDNSAATIGEQKLGAYPNPFQQFFTLSIPAANGDRVQVSIYDAAGRQILVKEYDNLVEGNNYLRIDATSGMSAHGLYIVRVAYAGKGTVKTFKLIKE